MIVRSVGLSTDLELIARRGTIVDRGDYLVACTPDDPEYYYGNLLVLPHPPRANEISSWTRRFTDELRHPAIKHVTLCWDGITGDVGPRAELVAAGFEVDVDIVMTAQTVRAAPVPAGIAIRPLEPDELPAVAELGFAIADRHDDIYRRFLHRRAAWKRDLVAAGEARFWGAFDGDRLAGSLGIVWLHAVARYLDVQTAASHRKRGIASALLAAAARDARRDTLVIIADPDGDAERVYTRAGFRVLERTASACRRPA
jgi:GNAT superfamily N-acetyltransferase